jgi:predicted Rossmann-fold nucleotide-binding protein
MRHQHNKRSVVGVIGSGQDAWSELTEPLGRWLAGGVMASTSASFVAVSARQGVCIGVIPNQKSIDGHYHHKDGYPNPSVELCINSPLSVFEGIDPDQISRNHIIVLSSDVLVALPGSKGTINEVELAVRFGKPVFLFGSEQSFTNFPAMLPRSADFSEITKWITVALKC